MESANADPAPSEMTEEVRRESPTIMKVPFEVPKRNPLALSGNVGDRSKVTFDNGGYPPICEVREGFPSFIGHLFASQARRPSESNHSESHP